METEEIRLKTTNSNLSLETLNECSQFLIKEKLVEKEFFETQRIIKEDKRSPLADYFAQYQILGEKNRALYDVCITEREECSCISEQVNTQIRLLDALSHKLIVQIEQRGCDLPLIHSNKIVVSVAGNVLAELKHCGYLEDTEILICDSHNKKEMFRMLNSETHSGEFNILSSTQINESKQNNRVKKVSTSVIKRIVPTAVVTMATSTDNTTNVTAAQAGLTFDKTHSEYKDLDAQWKAVLLATVVVQLRLRVEMDKNDAAEYDD